MRVSFDLDKDKDNSGKHKFFNNLRKELYKIGVEEVSSSEESDVHLFVRKDNPLAKKNILRVDGIQINEMNSNQKKTLQEIQHQHRIKIKNADGVIFQNEFCKKTAQKVLNMNGKNNVCIFNGADPEEFNVKPFVWKNKYFMTHAVWRPHKRLKETIMGFIESKIKGVDLLVYGKIAEPQDIIHKNVHYMGWADREELNKSIVGSVAVVNIEYLSWSPNSSTEAIVAGKQVIHTSSGGNPLIIKDRGYRIKDTKWSFENINLYDPPELRVDKIAKAYIESFNNPIKGFKSDDLYIANIAKQYFNFFTKTLSL